MKIKFILFFICMAPISNLHAMDDQVSIPALSVLEQTFFKAANTGNLPLFTECLNKGANCNAINSNGSTVLHTICTHGHYLLLPLTLQAAKIEINKTDKEGNTPLHCATGYIASQTPQAHALLFASLIHHGANVNARNNALETPLSLLLTILGQSALLSEILIDNGANISLLVPFPNPLNPTLPPLQETIFERAIRCNNPLHLYALLKSNTAITKPKILKAFSLTRFGFKNFIWGGSLWPKALAEEHLRTNFKTMAQILKRYYFTMQGLGFGKGSDWQRNSSSAPFPLEIAKKIAYHAAKDGLFTPFERRCLTILFWSNQASC